MSMLYIRLFKHLTIKTKHNSKTHKKLHYKNEHSQRTKEIFE